MTALAENRSEAAATDRIGRPEKDLPRVAVRGRLVAIVLSGLVAAVAMAVVLAERGATVQVAVAAEPIPAGAAVTPRAVRVAEVGVDSPLARSLLKLSDVARGRLTALHTIAKGEPISRAAVSADKVLGVRFLSIAVARENAVGGDIDPGDLVDVIDYSVSPARWVLFGAEVVRRAENDSRLGSLSGGFHVVVAVTDSQALQVADALRSGKVMLVRSTGAPPPATPPRAKANEGSG